MTESAAIQTSVAPARASASRSLSYLVARHLLRRRTLVARAEAFDLRLRFRTEDVVGRHIYKRGVHQQELTRFLAGAAKEVRPGDVIFDVGAHVGWFSLVLDRLTPEGVRIYAFEPDPVNHAFLRENVELNGAGKVIPVRVALSDREGTARLHRYHPKNLGRHSLLALPDGAGDVEVATTTLDRFRAREGLARRPPRLVKIDVEGYEAFVLEGARETLRSCPLVVQEHCPALLARAGIEPLSFLRRMAEDGFRPHRLEAEGPVAVSLEAVADAEECMELIWRREAGTGPR
jgi:FkbM family methyltransferase